jgi:hypothetical protein
MILHLLWGFSFSLCRITADSRFSPRCSSTIVFQLVTSPIVTTAHAPCKLHLAVDELPNVITALLVLQVASGFLNL